MLQNACSHLLHQRVVFLLMSWVFPFTLAYKFGFVFFLNKRFLFKSHVPLIFIYEMLHIACSYCFHQRIVCLISLVFPSTLAYRFGFVCLFWIHDVSHIYMFYECSMKTWVPIPPSTCRAFDFISVSFYFGLPIWICMSFLNLRVFLISHFYASSKWYPLILPWTRRFRLPSSSVVCWIS